jgi:hypothetical protein
MPQQKVDESKDDNPISGEAEFAQARTAETVLPELFGHEVAEQMLERASATDHPDRPR